MRCPECGSTDIDGPGTGGWYDCLDCGAAWIGNPRRSDG